MTATTPGLNPDIRAVLFDLDGVLTPTASVHEEAWRRLFTPYFEAKGVAPYTDQDYFEHLDGRARYDAVRAILESRGISVPHGSPEDAPEEETICGLGNRKNAEFNAAIAEDGIEPYPGSVQFLEYLDQLGPLKVAVVSSSKNAPEVLRAAGLLDHFPVIVDGNVADVEHLPGKPRPDTYLYAAKLLGVPAAECAVVEDAVSGVLAGRDGEFGQVIGVDRGAGAKTLAENGATTVVSDLEALVPPGALPDSDWQITDNQFLTSDPAAIASLLAITNGYLGIRGDVGLRVGPDSRGTFLNGLHESWQISHAEDAYGYARVGQSMVTLPDATALDLRIDGVLVTREGEGELARRSRTLDLATGTLDESLLWVSPAGDRYRIRQRAMVSLFNPHLAVVEVDIRPLDCGATVSVLSSVDVPVQPPLVVTDGVTLAMDDPRKANKQIEGAVFESAVNVGGSDASITYQTRASEMSAALQVTNAAQVMREVKGQRELVGEPPLEARHELPMATAAWEVTAEVQRGDSLRFEKVLSYVRDDLFTPEPQKLAGVAQDVLGRYTENGLAEAVPALFHEQEETTNRLWATGDVRIEQTEVVDTRPGVISDDPGEDAATLQATIRWCLFQILQASSQIQNTGVPAKGLTGSGYDGHYFWDAEIYVLPYLVYSNPAAARALLHYRYLTLDAARARAAEMHEDGALFPWRTIAGPESSAYYPAGTAQYHINAAIAYAINQYLNATGDRSFLAEEAVDMLVETARMWLSLGFISGRDEKFHINGVTGPDEYTAVVNDNLYTNVMARANLRNAARWLRHLQSTDEDSYLAALRRLALSEDEIRLFEDTADAMYVPWNEALGLHPQDAAFLEKQLWDFEGTPKGNYPLLLNYHPLVIYRHQVLKQSDTVLALYLLGSEFTPEEKRADFDYYDAITTGDSSLSAAAQSIMAAEVGHTGLAAEYFERLLGVDLADLHRNTDVGLHIASLGGTWSALTMGFAGLRDDTGRLRFSPRLPANWLSMSFTLLWHGYPLDVVVRRAGMDFDYRAPGDWAVEVEINGEPRTVRGSL